MVLLCALSLNSVYVCGEMGFYVPIMWVEKSPFGAVLGPFSLFSRSPSPHVRRFGLGVPGNGIRGVC